MRAKLMIVTRMKCAHPENRLNICGMEMESVKRKAKATKRTTPRKASPFPMLSKVISFGISDSVFCSSVQSPDNKWM